MKPAPRGEPLRLLVVEHDQADAELAVAAIERAGYAVLAHVAETPEELTARLDAGSYDLVVSDYRLPGWTAMDALALLRARGDDTPLIIVTGTLGDERAVDCVKQGASDYVIKDNLTRLPVAVGRALEERRLRQAQSASEERYRRLFESMPLPLWVFDVRTHAILAVNAAAVQHYGYSEAEFLALRTEDLRPPEDRLDLEQYLQQLPLGVHASGSARYRKRDGSVFIAEINGHAISWGGREAEMVVVNDVTERRRAEAELRATQTRLEQLLASSNAVIYALQVSGTQVVPLWVSDNIRRVLGFEPAEALEPSWWLEHLHPDDRGHAAVAGPARFAMGNARHEYRLRLKEGAYRWILDEHRVVRETSGGADIVGAWVDITDLKQADQALRQSEATYRSLVDNAPYGIYRSTPQGRFLAVNPALVRMLGYDTSDALLQLDMTRDVYADPAERARLLAGDETTPHRTLETTWKRRDGSLITVLLTARAVRSEDGPIEYFETVAEDITERRALETQLRQAQKMEAVGRLAGGVAHDFNNVLTAIFGYSDLLRAELPSGSSMAKDLEEIRKAAERAAGLTRQLLAFSRQQVLEPLVLSPNDLVEDLEKMLRHVIGEDVELRLSLARDVGNVRVDPGQIDQVLMNLVVNSRDAMPTGGKLLIETSNAELTEQYAEAHQPVTPGRYVLLAVTDTGVGMNAETRARAFEPFFTTKAKGKGTGLGLSTVYGIVKQSGGYVWVYSEPERGTTFKVYLPRVDAPAEPLVPVREPAGSLRGSETILVAEDDDTLRPLTTGLLERLGYTVREASNAREALALAREHRGPIHLLVADVVMPGASGRELARQLAETRPDTKVLYVSGYTDDAIVHHGMLEPGLAFLHKPFTPEALARKVREVIDGHARA